MKDNNMDKSCCAPQRRSFLWDHRLMITVIILVAVLALSSFVPWLVPFRQAFVSYLKMMWWALLIGFFLGGVIDHYVPREYVATILAQPRKRTIFYSVFLGFLMTVCNHGVLAIAMQFYKKGAATSSVVAFLLASPWANFPLTLMMVGFFGPVKAAFLVLSAIVIAVLVGLAYQIMEKKGLVDVNSFTPAAGSGLDLKADILRRFQAYHFSSAQSAVDARGVMKGIRELMDMTIWWLLVGFTLASLANAYIPPHFFHQYMGKTFGGMGVTLVAATFMETCSTGMSPLAFEIYRQTGALGNALVFLMAGVATNYTAIGLLWVNAGRRTALWMPLVSVPLILLFGYLGNLLFH
jgi:uncharacterized membrane protein YraQ (UPF0718 family)